EPTPSGPVLRDPLPTPPPPRSGPPPKQRGKNDRVRSIVLTVLAIVAAALIGILVASLLSSGKGDNNGAANTSSTSSLETTTTPTTPTTTETTTTATVETPAGPTPATYEQAVRDYYGLLPGNVAAAWSRMTPTGQQMSGGAEAYQAFWGGISSVTVLSAVA